MPSKSPFHKFRFLFPLGRALKIKCLSLQFFHTFLSQLAYEAVYLREEIHKIYNLDSFNYLVQNALILSKLALCNGA